MNFSVVIPLYNKAPHIKRTIDSVLAQTYQNFEIIVVNDGSTDNGPDIVSSYSEAKIILINQENQGVSVARNNGIKSSRFDFIAFLDADDEWMPDYLEKINYMIQEFPGCGAYATAYKTIRPDGEVFLTSLERLSSQSSISFLSNLFEIFQYGSVFYSSSVVVSRLLLTEIGGFPTGVVLMEDIDCWLKISLRKPIAFCPERLVIYHQDATNRSNIHKNLSEAPYVKTIKEAINSNLLDGTLKESALEYVAISQINAAIANILEGNKKIAAQLLQESKYTKKYKNKWIWWSFWVLFPIGWPKKLLTIKEKFR